VKHNSHVEENVGFGKRKISGDYNALVPLHHIGMAFSFLAFINKLKAL